MEWVGRARADLARSDAPIGRDLFVVVSTLVIVVVAQWTDPGSTGELLGLAPAAAASIALGAGVRIPLFVYSLAVLVPVTLVVGHDGDLEVALFLPVIATLYVAWHSGSVIRSSVAMALAAASPVIIDNALVREAGITAEPWIAANVFTFAMGLTLRQQRTLIDELAQAREALAEQAVADERRRIARELHDLAGHTLAAMMLNVTGARHVLSRDPAEADRALRDAEEIGRTSLDEIRATVAALRTDELGTDPALAGGAQIGDVVATYRRAGLTIVERIDPEVAVLTGPLGTAAHRIVQEALANVARHAPGNRVVVELTASDHEVVVTVSDHGRRPEGRQPAGSHFGLIGMRERARALGGDLAAGPHHDGWRVRAEFPRVTASGPPAPSDSTVERTAGDERAGERR